jgi:hypothetical protein
VSRSGENGYLRSTKPGSCKKLSQGNPEVSIFKSTNIKKDLSTSALTKNP